MTFLACALSECVCSLYPFYYSFDRGGVSATSSLGTVHVLPFLNNASIAHHSLSLSLPSFLGLFDPLSFCRPSLLAAFAHGNLDGADPHLRLNITKCLRTDLLLVEQTSAFMWRKRPVYVEYK